MKKMMINIIALLSIASVCFLSSCSKKTQEADLSSSAGEQKTSDSSADKKVMIKSYSFPEFLKDNDKPDILSKPIFKSFDREAFVKDADEDQFKNQKTDKSIGGLFFTFKKGNYVGLLDANGEEIIAADTYTAAEPVSNELLELTEIDGGKVYALMLGNNISIIGDTVVFEPYTEEFEQDGSKGYVIYSSEIDAVTFKDSNLWSSVTEVSKKNIQTKTEFEKCFKAARGSEYYYICFDKYGNYTVYNAEYAHILLKVGEQTGECYVQSEEEYKQLNSLMENFGTVSYAGVPNSEPNADYIQITFGLNSNEKKVMTVSPDGYCFTETLSSKNKDNNKYFSCLDKESFVSLVEWVAALSH